MTEQLLESGLLAALLSAAWITVVLLVRIPVSRWLGSRWAYALWLVPLVGLLALALPGQSMRQSFGWTELEVPAIGSAYETLSGFVLDEGVADENSPPGNWPVAGFALPRALLLAWALGACAFLLVFVLGNYRFALKMKRASRRLTPAELALVRQRGSKLGERPLSSIRMHFMGRSPAVTGLVNPVLLLPNDFFERYSPQQQVLMLKHEFQHLRRLDVFALFVARIYRCLFWFNPLVYPAERCFCLDQELSCDEQVLRNADRETRRMYGETLLLSLDAASAAGQANYSPDFGHIRRRTEMLSRHRRNPGGSILGALVICLCVGTVLVYTVISENVEGQAPRMREQLLANMFYEIAEDHFGRKEYRTALTALQQSEEIHPQGPTPASQALRSQALVGLEEWSLGLYFIERAISLTEDRGDVPARQWMLLQTALRWKLGDLDGAARSLEKTIEYSPDTSYGSTLSELNTMIQQSWEPQKAEDVAVRF